MKFIISFFIILNIFAYEEISSHKEFHKKITSYASSKKVAPSDILVVYDIDNTLMRFKTSFASDQWYNWQKEQLDKGCPVHCIADSVAGVLDYSYNATFLSRMLLVEKEIPSLIKNLQKTKYGVAALTSRGPVNYPATIRELNRNGVDLDFRNAPRLPFSTKIHGRKVRYAQGIFFTSGLNKGEMLTYLINREGLDKKYKAIFFLDDRLKHVQHMDKWFKKKLDIFSYRLTTTDKIVKDFEKSDKKDVISTGQKFKSLMKELN